METSSVGSSFMYTPFSVITIDYLYLGIGYTLSHMLVHIFVSNQQLMLVVVHNGGKAVDPSR
ncbi:hypothetical protein OUZ56_013484 [Daphnia magna]|uniref:Transmembrane protein n=1 Tax=Daphnia magna TaxID=35525 RepID=A0ABQ9Z638_9CRUS|nr:hypothetical protein OUZ56_013483 [Daphnia magna]KAK4008342.1 hypothetical protein OUZ56_013484 [Daphnia magna]